MAETMHAGRVGPGLAAKVGLAVAMVAVARGAAAAPGADGPRKEDPAALYVRKDTWPEGMIALREAVGSAGRQAGGDAAIVAEVLWGLLQADFPIACDWMQQDYRAEAWLWWLEGSGRAGARAMVTKVLGELGPHAGDLPSRWAALERAGSEEALKAQLELYERACEARRTVRLRPLLAKAPRLIFTKHYTLGGSHYAYTEGQSDAQAERHFVPGASLCLLEMDGTRGRVTTLLDDPNGVIRDPDVSFDARRVLFSWKKSSRQDDYHLYEMDLASRQVRQLTAGLGVADYEGCYLPDGDILFNSTRCVQIVDCWWTEVSNLYRCDGSGRFLRRLTFDQVHDNFPTVTEDGRILYTRWEYNDRGQIYPQPLLQMNPDGTCQMDFYGGNSWFPTTILHARMVPGSRKVVAIATGHHTRQTGKLILIDAARGQQEAEGVQLIAPPRPTQAVRVDAYGQDGELFQYPYPLSETEFLVTYDPLGWRWAGGRRGRDGSPGAGEHILRDVVRRRGKGAAADYILPRFGIFFMTVDGRRELLALDPAGPCNQPIPIRPRPVSPIRSSQVDYRRKDGTVSMQDVYAGPGLAGVARGTARSLRVVALDYRPAGIGSNGNGGPGGGAMISTPVAIGNGAWDPKIILGQTPIREDGSAFFTVPARTPVYFQVLDANGFVIQTMRSWVSLQGGENASCVGCHETKGSTPPAGAAVTAALRSGPAPLEPFHGPPRGFSFPKEVQPILDRHCTRCHNGQVQETGKRAFSLLGREVADSEAKRKWTESYLALTHSRPENRSGRVGARWRGDPDHPVVNWVSAQSAPPMLRPYSAGAARSRLIAQLARGHNDVRLSRQEMDKLAAWIDLGVPFCGDYVEANDWNPAERQKYDHFLAKRLRLAEEEQRNIEALLTAQGRSAEP